MNFFFLIDLSFNCIRKIEGLEKLKELTDISLFGNYIEKIDGLQNNTKLNVFSIGNNKLKSYEEVKMKPQIKNQLNFDYLKDYFVFRLQRKD